jgi:homoserine kinase
MSQRISVRVPATSANLGCLFDCAALALSLYLDLHLTPRQDRTVNIRYSGATPERVPTDDSNLIVRTIRDFFASRHEPQGFDLDIQNQIPVGVGLGSSAAAIVGALAASYRLAGGSPSDDDLVSLASRHDGHPDNVAAAWHGGFTVTAQQGDTVHAYSCGFPEAITIALVVPYYPLATEKARAVLPSHYSRADAVHNLQRAAVLAARIFSGQTLLQPTFFDDRWHQPYRASLVPGLTEALRFTHPDLLGVCLSGAGPSILDFARKDGATIGEALRRLLLSKGIEAQPFILTPDNRGAKGWTYY